MSTGKLSATVPSSLPISLDIERFEERLEFIIHNRKEDQI